MTVRIETSTEGVKTTVSVAGHLEERLVSEFVKTCLSAESELILDLTHLRGVDPASIREIQKLVQAGAVLRGASPFIRLLLDSEQLATTK